MLELTVHDGVKNVVLRFEHSLLSLSKWEARTKRAFLGRGQKTHQEMIDYYQDMLIDREVDRNLVYRLPPEDLDALSNYINDSQTASSVNQDDGKPQNEVLTSELIYAWLVLSEIDFHPTETWHVNRIMMLIQIVNVKKQPPKKRPTIDVMSDWVRRNEEQKKMLGITG